MDRSHVYITIGPLININYMHTFSTYYFGFKGWMIGSLVPEIGGISFSL